MSQPEHPEDDSSSSAQPSSSPLPPPPTRLTTAPSPIEGRLDAALRAMYALSNKAARRLITTSKVSVDGVVSDRWETPVTNEMMITVNPSAPNLSKQSALGARLVYQDDAIAVLAKPAGLLSAPQRDSDDPSALQAASRLCRGPRRPRVVHRLDKETSGLLLFARTIPAARELQVKLQNREVKRVYHCLVRGEVSSSGGYLSSYLLRDAGRGKRGSRAGTFKQTPLSKAQPRPPHDSAHVRSRAPESERQDTHPKARQAPVGQWALTRYKVIGRVHGYSALEVELFTGRTHQIRIHLSELGHPLVGEWVYGPRVKRDPRLALHAARLELTHPFSGEAISFEEPWPQDLITHRGVPEAWRKTRQPERDSRGTSTPTRSPRPSRSKRRKR